MADPSKPGFVGPYKYVQPEEIPPYPFEGPDDENYVERMKKLLPYSMLFGATAGVMDIMAYSKTVDSVHSAARVAQRSAFGGALLTTYCTTAFLSAKVRGKTDAWNHFLAGAACGAVLGAKSHKHTVGWGWGLFLGVVAGLVKQANIDGFQFSRGRTTAYPFGVTPDYYTKGILCKRPSVLGNQEDDD